MSDKIKVTTKKKAAPKRTTKAAATVVDAAPVAGIATLAAPTRDEISARAHELYVKSGHPGGRDLEFWLEAERQLLDERKV